MSTSLARLHGRQDRHAHRRRRGAALLEHLEDRRLLSVQATIHTADAIWNVRGTKSGDVIVIDRNLAAPQDLRIFRNGTLVGEKPAAEVKAVHVVTGSGSDVVRVDESV